MIRNPHNRKVPVNRIAVAVHSHRVTLDGMGNFIAHRHEIDLDHPEHGHTITSGTQFHMSEELLEFLRQQATPKKPKAR